MSEMSNQQSTLRAAQAPMEGAIGRAQVSRAADILQKYREGKRPLDQRVAEAEKWWMLKQWDVYDAGGSRYMVDPLTGERVKVANGFRQSPTAWLVNAIIGAQADAVEAYPEPAFLPREQGDEQLAQTLSTIVPVILSQGQFEETYSANAWRKHKCGTAVYGTFWDKDMHNGIGDVSVRKINFLNIFYQPGVDDLQKSQNIFHTEMVDREFLLSKYPQLKSEDLSGVASKAVEARTLETVRKEDLVEVVDWYYHRQVQGRKVLHYCKFVGLVPLYATENDVEPVMDDMGNVLREAPAVTGLYDDAEYPFDMDPLYPLDGSPAGMGMVDIGKGVQEHIDRLEQKIVQVACMGATPRYFSLGDGINEEEFSDWEGTPIVRVKGTGNVNEVIRQIDSPRMDAMYVNILNDLKYELKQTLGATDVAQGTAPSGVVAASALAILDENQGKPKRASIKGSYRAYERIVKRVIERIRQFYDVPRTFRIMGEGGEYDFQVLDNSGLKPRLQPGEQSLWQAPEFDVDVRPMKQSAYTRMAQNEMAMQFFGMGLFNPQLAEQAKQMVMLMDFKDKEKLLDYINQGQTMLNQLREYQMIAVELTKAYAPEYLEPLVSKMAMEDPEGAQAVMAGGQPTPGGDNAATSPGDNLNVKKDEAANVERARAGAQASKQPR